MYAIIRDGTKQYKVSAGTMLKVEKKHGEPDSEIQFPETLLLVDGTDIKIGNPLVKDTRVIGKIVNHGKDKKVTIIKFQHRKGYRRKQGHRQKYTLVKIERITRE